jgi:parallel beta-helix repeat protein
VVRITRLSAALVLASSLIAIVATGSPAVAGGGCDRFAAPGGSDGGNGSLRAPYRTAEKLADSLSRGQTGCFRAGTYRFSGLSLNKPRITLAPYRSEAVTLRGSIKVKPSGHHSTIRGMKLDGRGGESPIGPRIYANHVVLRGNNITNHHTSICVQIARYYSGPAPRRVVIKRNRIHDCGELPSTNKDHGIYVSEAKRTVIRDNWIYDNADRGVQLYHDADRSRVIGNVIYHNGDGMVINGEGSSVSERNRIRGNIIAKSYRGYNVYSGDSGPVGRRNILRKNCVWASESSPYRRHGGVMRPARNYKVRRNVVARPRFANARRGNLRLERGGRCAAKYRGRMSR